MGVATPFPNPDEIARAELLTRERFVYEGESLEDALTPGSPRRRALDAALREVAEGHTTPSVAWRREFGLLLGLERLVSEEEPHLVDGTVLSAHQIDALSGTLTALLAEAQRQADGHAAAHSADVDIEDSLDDPEEDDLDEDEDEDEDSEDESDEDEDEDEEEEDEEPQDWHEADEEVEDGQLAEQPEDPNAHKRFWFEHATGAGKTVAALGFVEATRSGGVLILTHRRNLVDQFIGELRDRATATGCAGRCSTTPTRPTARSPSRPTSGSCATRARISDAYTVVICDEAHTALGEKTSAADPGVGQVRSWIGMTATGALIARHVTDLFPTQTSPLRSRRRRPAAASSRRCAASASRPVSGRTHDRQGAAAPR